MQKSFSAASLSHALHFNVLHFRPSFDGHLGLKHKFQDRCPFTQTRTVGQPQLLQARLEGFTEPFCGRGKEVLHLPSK
jgi:hypothetical protein